MEWHEHNHCPEPVCPHCGHKHRDAWDLSFDGGAEGECEIECGECGKDYIISRHVSVSYSTTVTKGV